MIYILLTWLLLPFWGSIAWLRGMRVPSPRNILVLEIAGIGDVVCSTAVFRALRQHYPRAQIHLMVETASVDIIATDTNLNQVIAWSAQRLRGAKGRLALARRMRKFDTVICLAPGAAQLVAACIAAAPRRLSVLPAAPQTSYRLIRPMLTATATHEADTAFVQTQLSLLQAIGVATRDCRKSLTISAEARNQVAPLLPGGTLIGIAIGSGLQLKEISEQVLTQTIIKLTEQEAHTVILIGGKKERQKAARLVQSIASRQIVDTTGRLTIRESAAILEKLSLFIGVNSGITHIADALQVPVICLAGPSDIREQGPNGESAIILQRFPPCAPCDKVFSTPQFCKTGTRECIAVISADEIVAAAKLLLPSPAKERISSW